MALKRVMTDKLRNTDSERRCYVFIVKANVYVCCRWANCKIDTGLMLISLLNYT